MSSGLPRPIVSEAVHVELNALKLASSCESTGTRSAIRSRVCLAGSSSSLSGRAKSPCSLPSGTRRDLFAQTCYDVHGNGDKHAAVEAGAYTTSWSIRAVCATISSIRMTRRVAEIDDPSAERVLLNPMWRRTPKRRWTRFQAYGTRRMGAHCMHELRVDGALAQELERSKQAGAGPLSALSTAASSPVSCSSHRCVQTSPKLSTRRAVIEECGRCGGGVLHAYVEKCRDAG